MKSKASLDVVSRHQITSFKENVKGLLMKKEKNGKLLEERQIILLNQEQTSEFEKIGTASGEDLYHCLYLANKYGKDFVEKVAAYFVNNHPKDKRFKVEVTFYKKKEV
ncbi:MAG: hypothetical protein Q7S19_00410 [bacterium]|nr:hypothetical protein [bacterium]